MAGLEPTISESKSGVLPLHYIPLSLLLRMSPAHRAHSLWGGIWGSNPRHPEPQSGALPTELIPPYLARQEGFEPPTYCLEGSCSILLSYWRISQPRSNGAGDGNRTHVSSLEGWCSTIELHPHGQSFSATKLYHIVGPVSILFFFLFPRRSLRQRPICDTLKKIMNQTGEGDSVGEK